MPRLVKASPNPSKSLIGRTRRLNFFVVVTKAAHVSVRIFDLQSKAFSLFFESLPGFLEMNW